ncbi:unnamed protein product, partial [Mesorhabditis belari]|uniref:Uncharacterized protein n=1 Tax=Mesorhabditis belari TaxID=2138241 RepID=A0AAF3EMV8_9BILA
MAPFVPNRLNNGQMSNDPAALSEAFNELTRLDWELATIHTQVATLILHYETEIKKLKTRLRDGGLDAGDEAEMVNAEEMNTLSNPGGASQLARKILTRLAQGSQEDSAHKNLIAIKSLPASKHL